MVVRRLFRHEYGLYAEHLKALDSDGRIRRFMGHMSDEGVEKFCARLDPSSDILFGVFDREHNLVGCAHLALDAPLPHVKSGEIGISVLPGFRRRGAGAALMKLMVLWARNRRIHKITTCCMTSNKEMSALAKRFGAALRYSPDGAEGALTLNPADIGSHLEETISGTTAFSEEAFASAEQTFATLSAAWALGVACCNPAKWQSRHRE